MNVLLVDDEPATRRVLSAALARDGWNVLDAEDGEQALSVHGARRVHMVVSDWQMPRLDGLELCRRIRAQRTPAYTYFILLTGTLDPVSFYETAMRAGVDDFLVKPVDPLQMRLRLAAARRLLTYANRLGELESVIPVCAYCRRLRDDAQAYHKMEDYFERHAAVLFSHGVCPECLEAHFPEERRTA